MGDFIADTTHCSRADIGSYTLILCYLWRHDGVIAFDDIPTVARVLPESVADYRTIDRTVNRLCSEFLYSPDGGRTYRQKRVDRELAHAKKVSEVNQQASLLGVAARRANGYRTVNRTVGKIATERTTQSQSQSQKEKDIALRFASGSPISDEIGLSDAEQNGKCPPCPFTEIVAAYHAELPALPSIATLTANRKRAVQARWREVVTADHLDRAAGISVFRDFFRRVGESQFLTGKRPPKERGGRIFLADFDWLFNPTNFIKVVEGKYE